MLNTTDLVRMMLRKDAFVHHSLARSGVPQGVVRVGFKGMGRRGMARFHLAVHQGERGGVAGPYG